MIDVAETETSTSAVPPKKFFKLVACGVAAMTAAAGAAIALSSGGSSASAASQVTYGGEDGNLVTITCPGGPGVGAGTDLVSIAVEENTATKVIVSAQLDGAVPTQPRTVDGDIRFGVQFNLFPTANDPQPYVIQVGALLGQFEVRAGRWNAGMVNSTGFRGVIDGNRLTVSFDPRAFPLLPAARSFGFGARTTIERFVETNQQLGYTLAGQEDCPSTPKD